MKRVIPFLMIALLSAAPGCKIVYDSDTATTIPDGPDGDDARNQARLDETYEEQLLPLINNRALDIADFQQEIADGLAAAGEKHANRGAGQGAAWNFAVKGAGTITAAKLDTSARTLDVDTNGDGDADITVQLGPVIRGTALRDAAPFYNFDDFRDQIEFAKLARAINDETKAMLSVPDNISVGETVEFLGVVPLKKETDKLVLTPIEIEIKK